MAVRRAATFSELPQDLIAAAFQLHEKTQDAEVRTAIEEAGRRVLTGQQCYTPDEAARVKELSQLRATSESSHAAAADGTLRLPATIAANGANFLVIGPSQP